MSFEDIKITPSSRYYVGIKGWNYEVSELLYDLSKLKEDRKNPYFRHLSSVSLQRILLKLNVIETKTSFISFSLVPGEKFEEFISYLRAELNKIRVVKENNIHYSIILTTNTKCSLIAVANELHINGLTIELAHKIALDLFETNMGVCPVGHIETSEQLSAMIEKLGNLSIECNGHIYCKEKGK